MTRIPIRLDEKTLDALKALAEREFRDPRAQAVLIIREELKRRGLLPETSNETNDEPEHHNV